ncbi:MAG TPA: metal-dependent hydrolase [Planctomycetes bacterium]|nr:metal-dependent hydrolase [Planctomycetota bacterium]HIK82325.1 metal-dependent hydrolase [Planctomycetota bacterium]
MTYLGKETTFRWLGHASFLVGTPSGRNILIDPWLENPSCPDDCKEFEQVDLILLTHGHWDHFTSVVPQAKKHGARVVCNVELAHWLRKLGLEEDQLVEMNKGGTVEVCGLQVTMTDARHSSGVVIDDEYRYAGEACGFVVETENEFRFFYAGDTSVFGDMALIAELYSPSMAILPIGDVYTMGPREAAKAAHLLGVQMVIPMHFGSFPRLHGTPEQLREAIGNLPIEVIDIEPGQIIE